MSEFWRTASRSAHLPFIRNAEEIFHSFTASGRALFYFFAGLLVISSLGLLYLLNQSLLVSTPSPGGTYSEGIVGSPRFINPILAVSDADRDLVSLVYSGLLRATPDGRYVPDLAENFDVSEDETMYTFVLRQNATFHDGKPVTVDDVVFTILKTQNPMLKSPLRSNWEGVAVEKVDEKTVRFTLKSPYAPFIKNLTLGILPAHLWEGVLDEEFPFSELNSSPVGSGPFRINSVSRSSAGIPTSYDLEPFAQYVLNEPYLNRLTLHFYQSEAALIDALKNGDVQAASGISPALLQELPEGNHIERSPLNRVFGVFLNQNQSEVLRDKDVREALGVALDRQKIISSVLAGYGTPLTEPVAPNLLEEVPGATSEGIVASSPEDLPLAARAVLLSRGWEEGENGILQKTTGSSKDKKTITLSFSLSTGNVPELRAAAQELHTAWSNMGAEVEIKIFDQGDLSQNVIRPRKYDALLFGEVIGKELDLYPFWHSSQRNDPGLNIALYANSTADSVLESLRETSDPEERRTLYEKFVTEFKKDKPAIILYAPDFVYTVPDNIKGLTLGFIETPSDRFLSILEWHTQTDYVWPFFVSTRN